MARELTLRRTRESEHIRVSPFTDPLRYIESLRESECLQVLQPHVAEIWRMTYVTPAPTNPRTFVTLLLSRELKSAPHGERSFMNGASAFSNLVLTSSQCPSRSSTQTAPKRSATRSRACAGGTSLSSSSGSTAKRSSGAWPRAVTLAVTFHASWSTAACQGRLQRTCPASSGGWRKRTAAGHGGRAR